jgi:hypothetical protein
MSHTTNSFPFPVLEKDRFDYIESCDYEVSQVEDIKSSEYIVMEHKIKGDCLVSQLLKSNEATFATTAVLKSAMYRETTTEMEEISKTHVKQKIPIQSTFETQSFFTSIIYTGKDREIVLNSKDMGLDEFWDGAVIWLYKGAIIARDGWRELENSASDLLTVKKDESVQYGFDLSIDPNEGGRFISKMEPSLYDAMNNVSSKNLQRRSIITHILCVGFMELGKYFQENGDEGLTNFKAIKRELQTKGLKSWEDDDFNPNQIACYYLPHILKAGEDNE